MFREHQQIGVYTLIRKLGRGGFGEVWLAEKQSKFVTTKVAVKLPLDEQVDHEAIKQEASLWEQASGHPNILPIIDADEYEGQIVIVSEFAPDGSLEEWLKTNGRMSAEKAVEVTIGILNGLEFLHKRNIIHRDLKPANILLQGNTPRLADFGISRALRSTVSSQSTNVSGTFAYMSPEGFDGKRSVQTDIWSVGVCLYQFITGSLPFPQKEPSAMIAAIMMKGFEPLPTDVPDNLTAVMGRALKKDPTARYASAEEMRSDLERVLRDERVGFGPRVSAGSATFASPPAEIETVVRKRDAVEETPKRSAKWWMFAIAALLVVLGAGFGVYFVSKQTSSPVSTSLVANNSNAGNANSNSVNSEVLPSNIEPATPTPTPRPDKAQAQNVISQYIASSLRKDGLEELDRKRLRKVFYGDLDGDGDDDIAVEYLWNYIGGNGWGINLSVFRNKEGTFEFVATEGVGGKMSRDFKVTAIKGGKIYGTTETCNDPDEIVGLCGQEGGSGTKKGRTSYSLVGNRLVER